MKKLIFLLAFLTWHGHAFAGPVSPGVPAVKYIALSVMALVVIAGLVAKISIIMEDRKGGGK